MNATLTSLAGIVMGGGLLGAFAQLGMMRTELKKLRQADKKLPAEVEGMWLGGAEKAVGSLQAALDRAEKQVTRLENVLDRREARIAQLEEQVADMREQMDRLRHRLDSVGDAITDLTADPEAGGR